MASPDKLNDCYFYFYSTCMKGKRCPFRHCDQALGSEVVCELWRVGRCKDRLCPFRHMEPNINRSGTPCWFESQPKGCLKPHCVFQHSKPRPSLTDHLQKGQDLILPTSVKLQSENKLYQNTEDKLLPQSSEINISIEGDEESDDNDSHAAVVKNPTEESGVKVKTLEQIRMEKILSSSPGDEDQDENDSADEALSNAHQVLRRQNRSENGSSCNSSSSTTQEEKLDVPIVVKTLDQIRKERNGSDKSKDEVENQTPNLSMKRSLDFDDSKSSNSRPIKIRRNRFSGLSPNAVQGEFAQSTSQSDCDSQEEKYESSSSPERPLPANTVGSLDDEKGSHNNNKNHSAELDFDDEFDFDEDLPNNNHSGNIDVNLEDDELMREIDQVINS